MFPLVLFPVCADAIGVAIEEHERQFFIGALDSLGVALADHDHEWTVGERTVYEESIGFLPLLRRALGPLIHRL